MKWLPEPERPSCSGQCRAAPSAWSAPRRSRAARRSAARRVAPDFWLYVPADSGIGAMICPCSTARSRPARSSAVNCVRTAIIPQPMSTPTAAGMIAPIGRDHRADGRALAQVGVGHQRQVRVDERHRGGALGLLAGVVLEDRRPVEQAFVDLLHRPFDSLGCGHGCCAAGAVNTCIRNRAAPLRSEAEHQRRARDSRSTLLLDPRRCSPRTSSM